MAGHLAFICCCVITLVTSCFGFSSKLLPKAAPVLLSSPSIARDAPVIVLGAGPSGLSSAIMLAKRGYSNISVFERLPVPAHCNNITHWNNYREGEGDRFYNIGINGRGQRTLKELGVMEIVESCASEVNGRIDWNPETPVDSPRVTIFTGKTYSTKWYGGPSGKTQY